ncbi:MAG: OmpA family protein [Chitinophagaceae bacterium]|nr:OmpA family protein [Chitinophagaceae bacterium]
MKWIHPSYLAKAFDKLPLLFVSSLLILFVSLPTLAQAQTFELQDHRLVLPTPIHFKTGTAELSPESESALQHIKAYLEAKTAISLLRIEGHNDESTPAMDAQKLSEQRAMAVVRWLVAQGVDCKRLIPVGFGSGKPTAPNNTPEGKARNRRIEVVNAALRSRAIGGMPVDGGGLVAGDPCL